MRKLIHLLVLVMVVSGCATFSSQMYSQKENYFPTNPENIQIFKFPPPTPHKAIGEVEARGAPASKWNSLYRRLKEKAAAMGGDAIIVQEGKELKGIYTSPGYSTTTGGGQIYGDSFSYGSQTTYYPGSSTPLMRKRITGVVIKYTE